MKKFRELSEQYREEGRHKLIYPKNKAVVSPRPENDSAKAKLGEENSLEAFHKKNMNEEILDEGRPSQRHPLEGHEYHKKTNAELEYIAKDAHKAAEAMKSHNTQAENKYRDQANDSATVRYFRQKNGMPDWYKKKYGHMNEAVKDKFDIGEYDQEGDMAKSDLRSILANAKRVHDMLEDDDNLPEWCQNKITLAEDYISTVANYLTAEMNEEVEQLEEKNKPTNPELWSRAVSLARSKFDVYPSAYANGWAAKWYKSKGGGWRSVNEENYEVTVMHTTKDGDKGEQTHTIKNANDSRHAKNIALQRHEKMLKSKGAEVRGMATTTAKMVEAKEDDLPFTPDKPKKKSVVVGKKPEGYSVARHLARQAMQKQVEKMKKKPMKEETNKAKIVKDVMKKNKKSSEDAFQKDPELSSTLTKGF
jgi:hypothetical protein